MSCMGERIEYAIEIGIAKQGLCSAAFEQYTALVC